MTSPEIVFGTGSGNGSAAPTADSGERPYVIAFANEKGGTGKSTLSFHSIVALLGRGYEVGSIDADSRQGTLSRYLENRAATAARRPRTLALPRHIRLALPENGSASGPAAGSVCGALRELSDVDFVIIDTAGSPTDATRAAIANADTLISPINDSYVDIDVIARLDMVRREVTGPSQFTRLVWEQNNLRIAAGLPPIDWIVLRNRLTFVDSRNKRDISDLMAKLAKRIGFRVAPGFGERTIYRELFHAGLTVLDMNDPESHALSPSHVSAGAEMRALLSTVGLSESAGAA